MSPDNDKHLELRWDARSAATDDFIFGTQPIAFMVSQAHLFKPGMCTGGRRWRGPQRCVAGTTRAAGHLCGWFARGAEKAQRLAQQRGVTPDFVCADLGHGAGAVCYDAIVAIFIQLAGPGCALLFKRANQALKR